VTEERLRSVRNKSEQSISRKIHIVRFFIIETMIYGYEDRSFLSLFLLAILNTTLQQNFSFHLHSSLLGEVKSMQVTVISQVQSVVFILQYSSIGDIDVWNDFNAS
jgi:hypothetical protein